MTLPSRTDVILLLIRRSAGQVCHSFDQLGLQQNFVACGRWSVAFAAGILGTLKTEWAGRVPSFTDAHK
jgi:hypothetical protein